MQDASEADGHVHFDDAHMQLDEHRWWIRDKPVYTRISADDGVGVRPSKPDYPERSVAPLAGRFQDEVMQKVGSLGATEDRVYLISFNLSCSFSL